MSRLHQYKVAKKRDPQKEELTPEMLYKKLCGPQVRIES